MALLKKLAGQQHKADANDIKSITDNINHVLSCTRDYGYFLQDFGLSDYKFLCTREDIAKAISKEVSDNIERFEPRVILQGVESIKDDRLFRLSFRIDCVLRKTGQPLKLFLEPLQDHYQIRP
ncbi:MAG: GPW/gp25 family protein [Methylococcaceae bacterium]|jgi:predicted component of type VI protein secretion system